jgi:N6-L-threonylcarbamoyladenine synthase
MTILGIETSCDDTSAAIVQNGKNILSNVTAGQDEFHKRFSGVVPEIASRKHLELILPVVEKALSDADCGMEDIDSIAVTNRPGLFGSLLVGVQTATFISWAHSKPLKAVHHLLAHMYSLNLSTSVEYPYIGLLVSGGHTMLLEVNSPLSAKLIGTTLDDACGEAFDKVAKHYKLGYPGGPVIDRLSQRGDKTSIQYPRIMLTGNENTFNFSYSGLKTAVIYHTDKYKKETSKHINTEDICASFQEAAIDVLVRKAVCACREKNIFRLGIAGGVSANSCLREKLKNANDIITYLPNISLCTDNAAMVAGLAAHMHDVAYTEIRAHARAQVSLRDEL